MNATDDIKRKEAIQGLVNIALLEGVVLIAVVGVFLYTNNVTYLIGGMVGSALIFGPMILRWANEHKQALKGKPNSDPQGEVSNKV